MVGLPGNLMKATPAQVGARGGAPGQERVAAEIISIFVSESNRNEAERDAEQAAYEDSIAAMLSGRASAKAKARYLRYALIGVGAIILLFALRGFMR